MPGQSLPSSIDSSCTETRAAFERCKEVESSLISRLAVEVGIEAQEVEEELMDLRVASYLLLHAPSDVGKKWAASSIMLAVENDEKIAAFGQFIRKHYIRTFLRKRRDTPFVSLHPSPPSFDETQRAILANLDQAPQNHMDAKTKALFRDSYRCVLSDVHDFKAYKELRLRGAPTAFTHCAHIFDESTNDFSSAKIVLGRQEYTANIWTILRYMGYPDILNEFKGPLIHRLGNVMTLEATLHRMFDDLDLCLDATGNPNKYNVTAPSGLLEDVAVGCRTKVTLSNTYGLEPPSPTYLAIHAACYRIAHLSGAVDWYARLDAGGDAGCSATVDESMFATVLMDRLERLPGVEYTS
ncbi:hypothetical protein CYLTODRAFT_388428 [Cylindrobasidium torrendii FP15055 ss-10]|uniref:HNH nuclease domain-containing protein n=1 Tax=Cylindrobasidium torrendii FP15055 ss-10 TaxID=1314674 RepID=A0A0D7BSL7_9AGAR|nr:hypothetical protein CYLTODRAFT_388428 [Cylindrobasidium torrendii FP15055 ss-10]